MINLYTVETKIDLLKILKEMFFLQLLAMKVFLQRCCVSIIKNKFILS